MERDVEVLLRQHVERGAILSLSWRDGSTSSPWPVVWIRVSVGPVFHFWWVNADREHLFTVHKAEISGEQVVLTADQRESVREARIWLLVDPTMREQLDEFRRVVENALWIDEGWSYPLPTSTPL